MAEVVAATPDDALLVATTKGIAWEQTYRGIYPDEILDTYDPAARAGKERARIADPANHFYLFMEEGACIGYYSFGPYNHGSYKDFELCLNHLYILNGHKGRGLGRIAFSHIRDYCKSRGISKFFCGCNIHNAPAVSFYRHMGGIQGDEARFHENKADDIIHFEFHIGELNL